MAYKFQVGAATLSGSVTLKESATFSSGFSNADQNITNVADIAVDTISADGNDFSLSLTDNRQRALEIKEGSNIYLQFDSQDGAEVMVAQKKLRISDDVKLSFGASDDASFEYDEDGNNVLLYSGANLRIPDDTKIEFGSGGDAGIEYDENGTDQLRIHAATAGMIVDIGGQTVFNIDGSGNTTLAGNLTVSGETTSVNSTTINITSSLTFEGPADDFETTLAVGTPTADITVTMPQYNSAGSVHMAVLADATTAAAAAVTAAEFALLDGGSSVGTTALASGDGFLHNDGGTMKQTSIDKIADLFAGSGLAAASGVLSVDIDELSALGGTGLHQTDDYFIFSDAGTEKKITFSNLQDAVFADVSGDAAIAAGGALTIANDAVESGMLNDNVISGQTELAHADIADADELMISDGGTLKKVGIDSLQNHYFAAISGDASVADGGALTIAASAVEGSMLNDNVISGQDALGSAGVAQADELLFSDAGTLKKVTFSNFEDSLFGNVSGDATIAAGGALTIAATAVEGSMLNNNIVSGLTDIGAAIVGTDEMIISDAGTIKRTDMSRLKTFIGSGTAAITDHGDADRTLVVGVNVATANTSAARTWTLPASAGMSAGESVKIKVAGVSSGAITIARAGSQTIDGSLTSIVLESDNAAVELIYVGADDWRVF